MKTILSPAFGDLLWHTTELRTNLENENSSINHSSVTNCILLLALAAYTVFYAAMRLHDLPSTLLYLITLISHTTQPVAAAVVPSEEALQQYYNTTLLEKRCSSPCGYYGQLCCQSDEYCYTDANNEAQCGQKSESTVYQSVQQSTTANGQWSVYTTTYVQTDFQTVTTTYSSFYPVTTQAPSTMKCSYSNGETSCGNCCCQSGQICAAYGQCVAGSSNYLQTVTVTTGTPIVPLRPTSGTILTITESGTLSGTITTTQTFLPAASTGSSGTIIAGHTVTTSHGLSGGAIAGIVIGVIVGLILLFLLCACLCVKSLWDGLLSILGIRNRRRRTTETEYIEERRSRRHGGWFGAGPGRGSRTDVVVEEKDRRSGGGFGGIAAVGAALGGLALLLGLKRRRDRRREEDKSSVSYDSYYSSEYTSSSESP